MTNSQTLIAALATSFVLGLVNFAHATGAPTNPCNTCGSHPTQPIIGTGTTKADADAAASAIAQGGKAAVDFWGALSQEQWTNLTANTNFKASLDQNTYSTLANYSPSSAEVVTRLTDVGNARSLSSSGLTLDQSQNGSGNYSSRSYALAFSIPTHQAPPASFAAPGVGTVSQGQCVLKMIPDANDSTKFIPQTKEILYPEPLTMVLGGKELSAIGKKLIYVGQMELAGFGADSTAQADNVSAAGGFFSIFASGGKGESKAASNTAFKKSFMECDYEVHYFVVKSEPENKLVHTDRREYVETRTQVVDIPVKARNKPITLPARPARIDKIKKRELRKCVIENGGAPKCDDWKELSGASRGRELFSERDVIKGGADYVRSVNSLKVGESPESHAMWGSFYIVVGKIFGGIEFFWRKSK